MSWRRAAASSFSRSSRCLCRSRHARNPGVFGGVPLRSPPAWRGWGRPLGVTGLCRASPAAALNAANITNGGVGAAASADAKADPHPASPASGGGALRPASPPVRGGVPVLRAFRVCVPAGPGARIAAARFARVIARARRRGRGPLRKCHEMSCDVMEARGGLLLFALFALPLPFAPCSESGRVRRRSVALPSRLAGLGEGLSA